MCGIFGYVGKDTNAGEIILGGLKALEYRGYDSWGVAIKTDSDTFIQKQVGKIGDAKLPQLKSSIGIGHTRWATHGGVTQENAHPHTDCHSKIIVVHNGIIENWQELKAKLKNKHTFKSETDTEVVAHLLEEKVKKTNENKQAVADVFKMLDGLNAIIVFFPDQEEFYALKNSSPLIFGYDSKTNSSYLASDSSAILPHTNSLYFLEDNELLMIAADNHQLYALDLVRKKINFTQIDTPKNIFSLGSYPHYMIKEIMEQPEVIANLLSTQKQNIEQLAKVVKKAYGTYFIGCGTAAYAALAGTYILSKVAKRHANFSIGSEFEYLVDFLQNDSLVMAFSQSGETIDTISAVKKAKAKGAHIATITNVLGSTLYRIADYKLLLNAGPEKAVCSTKAFVAKIVVLYLLAYALKGQYDTGAAHLQQAIVETHKLLDSEQVKKLVSVLKKKQHIFILGRGVSYPAALESALKIKEVSYIHAEGFAGGELKHGVIALIAKGTPVIVYNPEDETYNDTLSSANEVKARGAYVIGISSKNNSVFDEFIKVKNCGDATIIPNVVVAQLLGYYLAVALGYDPDKPRNLAKSVTVK